MQEVLSKTTDPDAPLREQEFYELRLDDSDNIWRPGFIVREAHAQWHDEVGSIVWDEVWSERMNTLSEAQARYSARRQALADKGFIYSDMELS